VGTGTLCTLTRGQENPAFESNGFPYGSFVTYGLDQGNPVFLISTLAEHTHNLLGDKRASLLIAEPGEGDPLARSRVTLVGRAKQLPRGKEGTARELFLAAHPGAGYYVDFKDFSFWRLNVDAVRYIGGYGRMSWVPLDEWQAAGPCPISPHAARIIDHMNNDHADTMVLYCRAFTKATDTQSATMTGVDRYGFEMSVETAQGPRPIRLAFAQEVVSAKEVRTELVSLAKQAREQLGNHI
jgi:putative heme iron utilization protein